jgi:hypothetical protein
MEGFVEYLGGGEYQIPSTKNKTNLKGIQNEK